MIAQPQPPADRAPANHAVDRALTIKPTIAPDAPPRPTLAAASRLLRHPYGWIALGLGSGLSRWAPGTAGSAVAVGVWLGLVQLSPSWPVQLLAVALAVPLCIVAAGWAARALGRKDPGCIVSDELAGQWIALLAAPPAWPWWLAAFVLFRLFDIAKPWPMRPLERLPGGIGIVVDDVAAGLYVMAILLVARAVLAV